MDAIFFADGAAFRKWLQQNHRTAKEVLVGYYKKGTGKRSMSWSDSVDQALCFGWIDSVKRSIDAESYCLRFSPRKANSIWSAINIKKVAELQQAGLMTMAGMEAFSLRSEARMNVYAHEQQAMALAPAYTRHFKKNKAAWDFLNAQSPSYKRMAIHSIMSARQEKTQWAHLEKLIAASAANKKIL